MNDHEDTTDTETETKPEASSTEEPTTSGAGPILVPNRILENDAIEPGVVSLLSRARVVLLGYHELPEQTAPGQARLQFEDRARERLEDLANELESAGATVETRLVFTHDREQTLNRIADETGCVGTVIPNPAMRLEDVLVPLRGERSVELVAGLGGDLLAGLGVSMTLYHLERGREREEEREREQGGEREREQEGEPGDDRASSRVLKRAREVLEGRGVEPDLIETRIESSRTPVRAIVRVAEEYDAVIMGESDPSVTTFVFGETAADVAERFHGPVLVVRRRGDEDGPEDEPTFAVDRSDESGE